MADYKAAIAKLKPGVSVVFKVLRATDNNRVLTVYLSGTVPTDNSQ
jgi:hypothetical protein